MQNEFQKMIFTAQSKPWWIEQSLESLIIQLNQTWFEVVFSNCLGHLVEKSSQSKVYLKDKADVELIWIGGFER